MAGEIKVSDMTFLATIPDDAKIYIVKNGDPTPYYTTKEALLGSLSFQEFNTLVSEYKFSTGTTGASAVSGKIAFNNATPASVTEIYINKTTNKSVDNSRLLEVMQIGDIIYFQDKADSTKYIRVKISGTPVDNIGYYTYPVTVQKYGLAITNNDLCLSIFSLSVDGAGSGDMLKSVYDTDNSGVVDNAEKLGGELPAHYATATELTYKVDKVIGKGLSEEDYTTVEKSKLAGISGTNTGDETTSTIQTKRPIKTINGNSLEGSGNISVGGGDMTKAVYDTTNNGKVDSAEDSDKLGGVLASSYSTKTGVETLENKRYKKRVSNITYTGANVAPSIATADIFYIKTVNGTLNIDYHPTGLLNNGDMIMLAIKDDAGGARTINWNTGTTAVTWASTTDFPRPIVTPNTGKWMYLLFCYNSDTLLGAGSLELLSISYSIN